MTKSLVPLFIVFFIGLFLTYSNHFNNGFHFDDTHTIVDNVHIRTLKNIPAFFTDPRMFSSLPDHWGLRPVVTTTLAIDYWLGGGLNPFYFHLSTFIWFCILCILIYFVYKHLIASSSNHPWTKYVALGAMAWYALNPAIGETINYIISRSDILSTFFLVLSFFLYIYFPTLRKYCIYVIPAVIGVFAKETLVVLIPILFLYITLFEARLSIGELFKRRNFRIVLQSLVKILPLIIGVIAAQVYTISKTVPSLGGITNPFFDYVLTQSYVWVHYFATFFYPFNLSADTDVGIIPLFDVRILIGVVFLILLVYAIFRTSKNIRTRPIAFGLIWFACSLLPTSLVPLAEVLNDHRMFLPFIGLALSVVYTIGLWLIKYEDKIVRNFNYRILLSSLLVIILCSYSYKTYQRNKVWKDDETLWYDVTVQSPKNGRGLMNYGLTQMAKGNYQVALSYYERALVYTPKYYILFVNLGIVKNLMGKPQEAEEYFKQAVSLMPGLVEPYYYYARFLLQNHRLSEAKQIDHQALTISPYHIDGRYLLMEIYKEQEAWDSLQYMATKTLDITPNDKRTQQYLEASKQRVSALDAYIIEAGNHKTPENYLALSLQFYNRGMYEKCIEACNEALKLKPDYADAYSNICAAYNNLKQWDKAINACTQALRIDSLHVMARGNYNWAKNQKLQAH